jgi:plastocyanin
VAALPWAFPAVTSAGRSAPIVKVVAGSPTEFDYVVSPKSVAHGPVTFSITNAGTRSHSFSIKGKRVVVAPGQSTRLTVTLPTAGTYLYFCALAGHAAAGMKGALKVT